MRTIEKKWYGDVKLYHEAYADYKEFYETLMNRQSRAYERLETIMANHDASWVGVRSVEEAKGLLLNGWEKPLEQLKVQIDNELKTLENKKKAKAFNDVCGYAPIIPNALMRLPNAMINTRVERVASRVLRFCIAIDIACSVSTDEIIRRMSKTLAYIASLERSGKYRCRLEVFFVAFGGLYSNGSKYSTSCSVLVKSENQLFDTRRLCYPVINPSMLRLLMFGWNQSLPLAHNDYYVSGYGASFERWDSESKKAFIDAINENNENIICLDLNSNVEQVLKKGGVM